MIKYIFLFGLALALLISCSKKEGNPTVATPKRIERILIAPEHFLPLKSTDIYIGIRYFKDYTDKDVVTLTLNNQNGSIVSEQTGTIDGTNLLFKVPAINQQGQYKISCTVKNDQNSLVSEQVLRIVNDYSINTIWDSLDKNYSTSFTAYANRFKATGFSLIPVGNSSATQVKFGSYWANITYLKDYVDKYFIPGLAGTYTLKHNLNGLQEIEIINGEPIDSQNFNVTIFYKGLTDIYGSFISQSNTANGKITVFKNGIYVITVTETTALVSTVITKP